ncbi:UvrABC system protein C [Pirellula sp. SH-Sr6A]|nr:UvrABC system protein C [Pirellula sp. SH-Sr6A]
MDVVWIDCFEDFGEDPFLPFERPHLSWIQLPPEIAPDRIPHEDRLAHMKRAIASGVPRSPGVYGMLDATGRLIYVGKSKALRNRLMSYYLPNNDEDKSGRIAQAAYKIVWEPQPSEFAALLREQCLIRRWQPRFNVVGMPNRQRQAYLCLGKGPAEAFYLSRYHDPTAKCSLGPLSGVTHLSRAIEILTRTFRLRDCSHKTPMHFSNQLSLFDLEHRAGCVRHELGNCLAPCLPVCSKSGYDEGVAAAVRFLRTGESDLESKLQNAMEKAAAGLHFEYAARLREDLSIIRWITKRLKQFQRARESNPTIYAIYPKQARAVWYVIREGGVIASLAPPNTSKEWNATLRKLDICNQPQPELGTYVQNPDDTLGLVTSWFQKEKQHKKSSMELPLAEYISQTFAIDSLPRTWQEAKKRLHPPLSQPAA